jgi:predicted amidohydrolase
LKVACVQTAFSGEESKEDRIEHVRSLIDDVPPVDLIVLPELWSVGFFRFDQYKRQSESLEESIEGGTIAAIRELAVRRQAFVLGGSFVERGERDKFHNTTFLLGPDGNLLMTYRKIHVFGYRSRESELLTAGDTVAVTETPIGTMGTTTCYDLRFPELYRALIDAGAQVVLIPSAWPMERLDHWSVLIRARALENQVYVVACNMAGEDRGTALAGNSVVVNPWGEVISRADEGEQVLVAELDMNLLHVLREEFPVLKDRRLGTRVNMPGIEGRSNSMKGANT